MATKIVQFPVTGTLAKKEKKKPKGLMPDGRFRAWADLGRKPDGTRWREPFYSRKSFTDAKRQAEAYKAEVLTGRDITGAKQTIAQWATRWCKLYGSDAKFSANYSNDLYTRLIASSSLGGMRICDVREAHVKEFAKSVSGNSKSAVTKIRAVVKGMFRKAVANDMLLKDPSLDVKWTYKEEGSHRALEEWEMAVVVAHWREHRMGLATMIEMWAGPRRGEICALEWPDIDMEAGVIHFDKAIHFEGNRSKYGPPKTEAGDRIVPILPPLREAFSSLYGPPRSKYVCCSAKGKLMTQSAFKRGWESWLNAMTNALNGEERIVQPGRRNDKRPSPNAVFNVRSHDLRHTFCTILYDAGVDIKTAQEWMGHADADMVLEIYAHLSKTRRKQSHEGLEKWCSKWCSDASHLSEKPSN